MTGDLQALMDATWPPLAFHPTGPWLLREGAGGGSRVSAATARAAVSDNDIALAESGMCALGQAPLFMVRGGEAALDAALAARGYGVLDPVVIYAADCARLCDPPPAALRAFALWPPLEITRLIWAEAGVGPARLAIMDRAAGPKAVILGRTGVRSSGVAFVACHGSDAMLHALEVVPAARRQGSGEQILRQAAVWATEQAATRLLLAVTQANGPARALYAKLGMDVVAQYHYRQKQG